MAIGGILILLQPDLGTFMIYGFICMSILLLIGIKYRYILGTIVFGFLFIFLIVKTGIIGENRMMRINVWLDPGKYENTNSAYQLQQAKIAIGSGGIFGKGVGNSIQKFLYLPEVSSDSIFAIASEEFGFIFISIFLLIYLVFILRGFYIAKRMDNEYIKYIIAGSTGFIAFQYFVNISTMTGILPLTGVPMPFVSYGNSLMVVMITSSALTFGFSRYTKEDIINDKK
jgi:cell division protein FtsW